MNRTSWVATSQARQRVCGSSTMYAGAAASAMLSRTATIGFSATATQSTSHHLNGCSASSSTVLTARRCFMSNEKSPYTILGIKNGASKIEIKKAYRVMAAKHHPDAAGGSSEKFQEIQAAYEEIKTGVWIPKDGGGGSTAEGGGGGGRGGGDGKYKGFQWYTDGKKTRKVDFSKMQQRMHGADEKGNTQDFDDDEEEELASKAKGKGNPAGASEATIQAWFRFITRWATVFVTLRVTLFLMFPPKHQHTAKKPLPDKPRRPPPRPIQHSPMSQ